MKRILSIIICIALLLCGCSAATSTPDEATPATPDAAATKPPTEAPTEPPTDPPTEPPTDPPTPKELAQEELNAILAGSGPSGKASVSVPEICQYPDLPTGCEAVALTIALQAMGCDISETEFASRYLIIGDDIVNSFVGDPFEYGGAGIFPPGLVKSAEKYIDASGAGLAAFDLTGTSMDDLYKLLDKGLPVVVWTTYYLSWPQEMDSSYKYNGHTVYWYINEHCMCLYGYDKDQGTVSLSDPIQGKITESAYEFEQIYNEVGRMAMVLVPVNG